jgi:hypothetical protein
VTRLKGRSGAGMPVSNVLHRAECIADGEVSQTIQNAVQLIHPPFAL